MKTIYVILAPSRSGKDSLHREIYYQLKRNYNIDAVGFKWSDHVKRVVEDTYGLLHGALESDEIRNSFIPGTTTTYLQVLVSFYHLQESMADQYFWKRPMVEFLESCMKYENTIISTDTRDLFEAEKIIELSKLYGYEIAVIKLKRDGCDGLSSDRLCDQIYTMLSEASLTEPRTIFCPDSPTYKDHLAAVAREVVAA